LTTLKDLGCYLISIIGTQGAVNANLVLGVVLVVFVLLVPQGLVPVVRALFRRMPGLGGRQRATGAAPLEAEP